MSASINLFADFTLRQETANLFATFTLKAGVADLFAETLIAPVVAATDGGSWGVGEWTQRNTFYYAGRHWIFYLTTANMIGFVSSEDGLTNWTGDTIRAAYGYTEFSIFFDGEYVHYVWARAQDNNAIFYRRGIPQPNGTISWSAAEQTAVPAYAGGYYITPTVAPNSDGYPFVGFCHYDPGVEISPWVIKSDNTDGTWSGSETPHRLGANGGTAYVQPVPLTNGELMAVYGKVIGFMQIWDGIQWNSEVQITPGNMGQSYSFSCCSIPGSNKVWMAYLESSKHFILQIYDNGSWGSVIDIDNTNTSSFLGGNIGVNSEGQNLWFLWGNPTPDLVYVNKSVDGGVTWAAKEEIKQGGALTSRGFSISYNQGGLFPGSKSSLESFSIGLTWLDDSPANRVFYKFYDLSTQVGWKDLPVEFEVGQDSVDLVATFNVFTTCMQDFTTYTEVDPNNKLSQTKTASLWDGLIRNEDAYLYKKLQGVVTPNKAISWNFEFEVTEIDVSASRTMCDLIRVVDEIAWTEYLRVVLGQQGHNEAYTITLRASINGNSPYMLEHNLDVGTKYFCTLTSEDNRDTFRLRGWTNPERSASTAFNLWETHADWSDISLNYVIAPLAPDLVLGGADYVTGYLQFLEGMPCPGTALDLFSKFEVRQADTKDLYAKFEINDIFIGEVFAKFLVQHTGTADLYAELVVRHTDTEDLFSETIIRKSFTLDLKAVFRLTTGDVNLFSKLEVRKWPFADPPIVINVGSVNSGDIYDIRECNGKELTLNETFPGIPAFSYDFYFEDIPDDVAVNQQGFGIHMTGYYKGNPAHRVKLSIYNYNTTSWEYLTAQTRDLPSRATPLHYHWFLDNGSGDYVDGTGQFRLRFAHINNGSNLHLLHIDCLYLHEHEHAENLYAFFEVYPVADLFCEFTVRQEKYVRRRVYCKFEVRHTASLDLHAEFFLIRAVGPTDLFAEFFLNQYNQTSDLYNRFYIRAEIDPQYLDIKPDELRMDIQPDPPDAPLMQPIIKPARRRRRNWLR